MWEKNSPNTGTLHVIWGCHRNRKVFYCPKYFEFSLEKVLKTVQFLWQRGGSGVLDIFLFLERCARTCFVVANGRRISQQNSDNKYLGSSSLFRLNSSILSSNISVTRSNIGLRFRLASLGCCLSCSCRGLMRCNQFFLSCLDKLLSFFDLSGVVSLSLQYVGQKELEHSAPAVPTVCCKSSRHVGSLGG